MSQNISEIVSQNKESFLGREKEVEEFLKKNYKKNFENPIIKFERIDATDRIKKAGFQKKLSTWQNVYKNVVVVSCLEVTGEKKRYDYKFYFIEERLDEKTLEHVENAIKESVILTRDFKFDPARAIIDKEIETIKVKDDKVINKRLQDARGDVGKAETDYTTKLDKIEKLESTIKGDTEAKNYDDRIKHTEEMITLLKAVKKNNEAKEYESNLKEAKKEREEQTALKKQIAQFETGLKKDQETKSYQDAITKCEKLIELSKLSGNKDLEQKYSALLNELQTKLSEQKEQEKKLSELEESVESNRSQKLYEDALKNCDELIVISKAMERQDLVEKYTQTKEQIQKESGNYKSDQDKNAKLQKIETLDSELKQNREASEYEKSIENSDSIIVIAKELNREDLLEKYKQIEEEIKKERDSKKSAEELNALKEQEKAQFTQKVVERNAKKEKEDQELKESAKELEGVLHVDENVMPIVESVPVKDIIGDVSSDVNEALAQMTALFDEHRVSVKNEITNSTTMTTASGKVSEKENVISVQETKEKDQIVQCNVQSGLINPFDEALEEAILSDIIPYNFEISKVDINGKEIKEFGDKKFTKDGLELTWKFQNVQPNEKIEVDYNLRRRVSRTIIFVLKEQVKIIKTHSNITKALNIEGLYDAPLPFTNTYPSKLDGTVIEDIIPLYYVHFIKEPRHILPSAVSKASQGSLVKWGIGTMKKGTLLEYFYKLLELYKFEDLKMRIIKLDAEGIGAFKSQDLITALDKYEEILKELNNYR